MGVEDATTKKISGDGLSLKLQSNKQILEITGDGCNINLTKNIGCVKIVGDGCRLRIEQNLGDVEYTGDGGRVLLGAKSAKDKVKYTGDGGKIVVDGDTERNRKCERSSRQEVDKDVGRDTGVRAKGADATEKKEARSGVEKKVKIVTTFQFDDKNVNKWFVDAGKMVMSFDGASFVKIVPKQRKTTIEVKH